MFSGLFGKLASKFVIGQIKKYYSDLDIHIGKIKIVIPIEIKGNMNKESVKSLLNEGVNNYIEPKLGNSFDFEVDVK